MAAPFAFPMLPELLQKLADILLLAALVDLAPFSEKLHVFQLSGRVPLWNWPITIPGARLLLQPARDKQESCCLDAFDRAAPLHCIDGSYGDLYPSSTPATTRLWLDTLRSHIHVPNRSPRMLHEHARRQKLEVVLVSNGNTHLATANPASYRLLSLVGWLLWAGAVLLSLAASLHIASAYLFLLPLTGLAVTHTHGGRRHRLLDTRVSGHQRAMIATNSLNSCNWWFFLGDSPTVNSLLNKPLRRAGEAAVSPYTTAVLAILMLGQWALAGASCVLQDGNALVISAWLVFCAASSACFYPARRGVRDWLETDCGVRVVASIAAEFSSRRSMLGAMVYLNPDTKTGTARDAAGTGWMNPILAPGGERARWEAALLRYIEDGSVVGDGEKTEYWHAFIEEGVDMGREIGKVISECLSG